MTLALPVPPSTEDWRNMVFKERKQEVLFRLAGITLTSFLLAMTMAYSISGAIQLFFAIVLGLQLYYFIRFEEPEAKPFSPPKEPAPSGTKAHEEEFQYLKNIVQHAGTGLITFDSTGEIQIINTAAKQLLDIEQASHLRDIEKVSPRLTESFRRLKTGGRDLVRTEVAGHVLELSVYAIQLNRHGEEFKLISLQNIQSELEEKEMEAWQNLVKVLTHEIMNSVTPISSLAHTVSQEIEEKQWTISGESPDDLEDVKLALATIQKRSEGLIRFVKDFRSLTRIPKPELTNVLVIPLLEEVLTLYRKEINDHSISVILDVKNKEMSLNVDKDQIHQVLINLLQNAIQALAETPDGEIRISASVDDDNRPFISIRDNGPGIEEAALERIFIPFFTTKKRGSGIGLSLSRQIMRQHRGSLLVKSVLTKGTEFIMRF